MSEIEHYLKSDRFVKRCGIELLEARPGYARTRMVLEPSHWNALGFVQGGAIFTLADYAFAAASNAHGTVAVGVNVNISYMKAAKTGTLIAEAKELSRNHKLGTYSVEVRDDVGDLVAIFQGLAYRKKDHVVQA